MKNENDEKNSLDKNSCEALKIENIKLKEKIKLIIDVLTID